MIRANFKSSITAISCVALLSGCTVYSPIWRSYSDSPSGPITGSGHATSLVNRCEVVDIRLGSGYKCLDNGFKDAVGDVIRLETLRNELKDAGPRIQHLIDAERSRFSKKAIRYKIFLVAIKPSVYVGVPLLPGEQSHWCGDVTCIAASWPSQQKYRSEATLIWREQAPVRKDSFWFAPEIHETSEPLPLEGVLIQAKRDGQLLKLTPNNGFWAIAK